MNITKIIGKHGQLAMGGQGEPTAQCARGSCPAALIADNGDVFVQGYIPAPAEGSVLTAPAGENFVRMSRSTFESIARQVLAS